MLTKAVGAGFHRRRYPDYCSAKVLVLLTPAVKIVSEHHQPLQSLWQVQSNLVWLTLVVPIQTFRAYLQMRVLLMMVWAAYRS